MPERPSSPPPPDQAERTRALDPAGSFLVQAPAGSGKTYLLTQRFLRLLADAEKPDEIVAITFTKAAAAEMRNRVLEALEDAERAQLDPPAGDDPHSLPALAAKALERARLLDWRILDLPNQLRITTIDSFCRSLAMQSPLSWGLLSGLGGNLDQVVNPGTLYRRAAARTLDLLQQPPSPTRESVEKLLLWRDNNWSDVETLIVEMLRNRNRWFQDFVFTREEQPQALRERLEAPFRRAALTRLKALTRILDNLDGCREFALELARLACRTPGKSSPLSLAERAELPVEFTGDALVIDDAIEAYRDLANFLLIAEGQWRKKAGLNVNNGFPANPEGRAAKERLAEFIEGLAQEPGLRTALAAFQRPIPVGYTEDEWQIIRHCFDVLRHAAGQLQVVFAETGSVDFTEVAQIALRILAPEDGIPSETALRQADAIRHLLVDEFQDTSRSQHQLLSRLIAAWPDREGRSCFCVGDPMQSIYGFRDAEVELFERLKTHGLEPSPGMLDAEPFRFEFVSLRANFRTAPTLVRDLNQHFERIFTSDEGDSEGIRFAPAEPARESPSAATTQLHLAFTQPSKSEAGGPAIGDPESTRQSQLDAIVALIQTKLADATAQRASAPQDKFRIAVLGRTRNVLAPIAEALREANIPFRAIDLVRLRERPEVLDALALVRALLNPADRTAWLGVLRAPWCGLSLAELHLLTSADSAAVSATSIPMLLETRLPELFAQGQLDSRAYAAASRVARVLRTAIEARASSASTTLGTWLESIWTALGGAATVAAGQQQNLSLLWATLDGLTEADLDLLGPALNAALDDLYALPDPAASSNFGVQLMTIHKSKGLEFEVVLVPDLEASTNRSTPTMVSWLERGLAGSASDDSQLSEFLIAPIQAKGTDRGAAQAWVESVKRARETEEMRRLLYVAATRAREELHLFARPRFTISSSGDPALAKPSDLLATAWPALEEQIQSQFETWTSSIVSAQQPAATFEVETLAAQAASSSSNLLQMPAAFQPKPTIRPTVLHRLPENYAAPEFSRQSASSSHPGSLSASEEPQPLYARTEGGFQSRLLGQAIHSLLEEVTRLRHTLSPVEATQALAPALPAITAQIRSQGMSRSQAEQIAAQALRAAQQASTDPTGAWIFAPHPHAESEARWTALPGLGLNQPSQASPGGAPRDLRPDRVFFAPALSPNPGEANPPVWWIIDYKTSHAPAGLLADEEAKQSFIAAHRLQHQDQLAVYAQALRWLYPHGKEPVSQVRAGIFYPRLLLFDSWPI